MNLHTDEDDALFEDNESEGAGADEQQEGEESKQDAPLTADAIRQMVQDAVRSTVAELTSHPRTPAADDDDDELSYNPKDIQQSAVRQAGEIIAKSQMLAAKAKQQIRTDKKFAMLSEDDIDSIIFNIQGQGPQQATAQFEQGAHIVHAKFKVGDLVTEGQYDPNKKASDRPLDANPVGRGAPRQAMTEKDRLVREYKEKTGRTPKGKELAMLLGEV